MNVEKALSALRENGFDARWFATAAEAADALCAEVKGKTVGIGGSVTVEQLGVYDTAIPPSWNERSDRKYTGRLVQENRRIA